MVRQGNAVVISFLRRPPKLSAAAFSALAHVAGWPDGRLPVGILPFSNSGSLFADTSHILRSTLIDAAALMLIERASERASERARECVVLRMKRRRLECRMPQQPSVCV